MNKLAVRTSVVIVLLGLFCAASFGLLYPVKMQTGVHQASRIPLEIGPWVGREIPVEDYVKQILETDDVIQRSYTCPQYPEQSVQMSIVYSANNRRVAHPPEVCYRGSGWENQDRSIASPEGLPQMVRLIMAEGSKRDLILYCYQSGDQLTANYYQQQINIIRNLFLRRSTSSALIRFSTYIAQDDEHAQQRLLDFMHLMMPEVQRVLSQQPS